MTNEMVHERTSNLVMPSHYVELDSDEMSYVEGGFFLGFSASRDACVALFNSMAKSTMCRAVTGTTLLGALVNASKVCFPALYAKVVGILSAAWGKFCSLFTTGGPAGWVVGGMIAVVGVAAISYVAGMLVCGAMGHGFKIGFEVGWFTWDPVCTFL